MGRHVTQMTHTHAHVSPAAGPPPPAQRQTRTASTPHSVNPARATDRRAGLGEEVNVRAVHHAADNEGQQHADDDDKVQPHAQGVVLTHAVAGRVRAAARPDDGRSARTKKEKRTHTHTRHDEHEKKKPRRHNEHKANQMARPTTHCW